MNKKARLELIIRLISNIKCQILTTTQVAFQEKETQKQLRYAYYILDKLQEVLIQAYQSNNKKRK